MNNTITLNKLQINLDHENIDGDFDIYEFATSDKYIKYGAKILDEIAEEVKALSIVFESGKKFYALYNKQDGLQTIISHMLKLESFKMLSARKIYAGEISPYLLGQLLLNSLNNYKNDSLAFNNITGKLFCTNLEWCKRKRTKIGGSAIKQIPCLEIKIDKNNVLNFPVTTFTAITEKDRLIFKKKKIYDYPMYRLAQNATLRRMEFSFDECNFMQKQYPNTKNAIKFIDFCDYEKFLLSKCGVLYKVLKLVEQKLSNYLSLKFAEVTNFNVMKGNIEDTSYRKKLIENTLDSTKINIVNKAIGNGVEAFKASVIEQLNKLGDYKIESAKDIGDGFNVVIINNKEYYEKYEELEDIHNISYGASIVQHITFEDYNLNLPTAIRCIINELIIKKDCKNKQITFSEWCKFGCNLVLCLKNKEKYAFVEVDKTGNISYRTMGNDIFSEDTYQSIIDKYIEFENTVGNNIESVIKIDNNIIGICKSGLITLPKFVAIGNQLAEAARKETVSKKELQQSLESILNSEISDKTRAEVELLICNLESRNYSKLEITTMSSNRNLTKLICNAIYQFTGKKVKCYFRSNEVKFNLFGSNLNINWFCENGKTLYFVGEKNEGIQSEFARASVVREVCLLSGSEIDMEFLTKLMTIDFVRNEQYTVGPFLIKYLRELIKMSE